MAAQGDEAEEEEARSMSMDWPSSPSLVVRSPRQTVSLLRNRRHHHHHHRDPLPRPPPTISAARDHGPKPSEVYGFVGSITTVIATAVYLAWAYTPEPCLRSLGITYYPSKYWALAVPSFIIVAVVLSMVIYMGLNFLATPPPTSFNVIFASFLRSITTLHSESEAPEGRKERLREAEYEYQTVSMGLHAAKPVDGGDILPPFLRGKSRYARMDDVLPQDQEENGDGAGVRVRGSRVSSSRRYVFACSVFASLNHVLLGYDVGVMSGCIIFIQKDLHISEVQQEVLVGCLSFISLLGSIAAGRTSDVVGRKWTIGLAAAVFQAGAAIMTFAPSFAVLMGGRLLAGVGIGIGIMVAPVYISEITPASLRGSMASFPEIFISFGILLGYVSNLIFAGLPDNINWRVMLAAGILPSVSIAFVLVVIPESPRWLVMQDRAGEARAVLIKVTDSEEEAEERLFEIEDAARVTAAGSGKAVWRELLIRPSPVIRRMLITGVGVQVFQQATGIDALVYYSPTIFRDAGITTERQLLAATVAVGLTKTAFIVVAIVLVDRVGRKPLLYVSTVGITACLAALAASLSLLDRGALPRGAAIGLAVVTVCGFVAFFSVGIGPINMVLSSEIFPLRLRAQAVGIGFALNRMTSGAVAMSFLSICNAVSVAGAFTGFAAVSALSVAFVHLLVPETSGKTLEQIESLFGGGDGATSGAGEVELGDVERLGLVHARVPSPSFE